MKKNRWGQTLPEPKQPTPLTMGLAILAVAQYLLLMMRVKHVIDWPWYWVFLPVWIVPAVFVVVLSYFLVRKFFQDHQIKQKYGPYCPIERRRIS